MPNSKADFLRVAQQMMDNSRGSEGTTPNLAEKSAVQRGIEHIMALAKEMGHDPVKAVEIAQRPYPGPYQLDAAGNPLSAEGIKHNEQTALEDRPVEPSAVQPGDIVTMGMGGGAGLRPLEMAAKEAEHAVAVKAAPAAAKFANSLGPTMEEAASMFGSPEVRARTVGRIADALKKKYGLKEVAEYEAQMANEAPAMAAPKELDSSMLRNLVDDFLGELESAAPEAKTSATPTPSAMKAK